MISREEIAKFEADLNSFDAKAREHALVELIQLQEMGEIKSALATDEHNLHCHTFFSYNGYGFSPSYIAWWTKKENLFASGTVDFDVLDAVDEFLKAASKLDIRAVAGIETRVFIPELADKEINSPGEPGIAYHMGMGFTSGTAQQSVAPFLAELKKRANDRTREIVSKVNAFLAPAAIDFEKDAVPLTPAGNVTERHVCEAYAVKASKVFSFPESVKFWTEKLGLKPEDAEKTVKDSVKLQGLIRAKTMKSGGVGYVNPDPKSFPLLKDMNDFISKCGAIPTIAWLNGDSAGEADVEALLELHIHYGAAVLNIIPDRNWNFSDPAVKKKKVAELYRIIEAAKRRNMPIVAGTEMNAPGQKLVDDFSSDALKPCFDEFVKGAAILSAHTLLQRKNMGYLSEWAKNSFGSLVDKNKFFADAGRLMTAKSWNKIKDLSSDISASDLLKKI